MTLTAFVNGIGVTRTSFAVSSAFCAKYLSEIRKSLRDVKQLALLRFVETLVDFE